MRRCTPTRRQEYYRVEFQRGGLWFDIGRALSSEQEARALVKGNAGDGHPYRIMRRTVTTTNEVVS